MLEESHSIYFIYLIGTFGMAFLAFSIVFFFITYQKKILKKQLELNETRARQQEEIISNTVQSQENERKRIARDLHDEVGAMLSVVKLNVSRIEKKSGEPDAKILAAETKQYLDEVITQVRRISRALLPPSLEKLGLWFAVEELVNWINKSDQIQIDCRKNGEPARFDQAKELALFRIIQELLNNSIKHSGSKTIDVYFRFSRNSLIIMVSDQGKGFDLNNKATGLGLKNLESRAQIAGAKFRMKSAPGKGTKALLIFRND